MNRVYLLGAGASRDLRFIFTKIDFFYRTIKIFPFYKKGPLSLGFFYDTKEFFYCVKEHYKQWSGCFDDIELDIKFFHNIFSVTSQLIKCIEDYYCNNFGHKISIEQIFNDKAISDDISIEDLYIDIEKNCSGDKKMLLTQLLEYYHKSLSFIGYYSLSLNHLLLAKDLIEQGGDVISFNWDILLEEALYKIQKWDFCDGYFINFERTLQKIEGKKNPLDKKYFTQNLILKPHGSINWFSDNSNLILFNHVEIDQRGGYACPSLLNYTERFDENKPRHVSAIVPPGYDRLTFPEIWKKIDELLSKADEIIIIGFKIKETDGHIEQKLRDIEYKKDLKVKVIDPNADKLIEEKYKGIFKDKEIINLCPTFTEYCKSIDKNNYLAAFEGLLIKAEI